MPKSIKQDHPSNENTEIARYLDIHCQPSTKVVLGKLLTCVCKGPPPHVRAFLSYVCSGYCGLTPFVGAKKKISL